MNLTATTPKPTFVTNAQNGLGVVRFSGTDHPLTNDTTYSFRRLWIVAKYSGDTFANSAALITDIGGWGGLIGVNGGTNFQSLPGLNSEVNWRAKVNGVSVDPTAIPAPMNAFKLIEIIGDAPVVNLGISIGQNGSFTTTRWTGDFGELIISQSAGLESDDYETTEYLMTKWGLS